MPPRVELTSRRNQIYKAAVRMIETGMVGRDGIMGTGPALDDRMNLTRCLLRFGRGL